ncbi:hypothetical protein F4823DRAFT_569089 [Ustulina deusta]|nr:hypothetical protein F4823DRAFT_569089 [Ustulina deusta]
MPLELLEVDPKTDFPGIARCMFESHETPSQRMFQAYCNGVKDTVGWDEDTGHVTLAYDRQSVSDGSLCYPSKSPDKRKRVEDIRSALDDTRILGANETIPAGNTVKRSQEVETLEIRQSDGAFPGWGYNPYLAIVSGTRVTSG